MVRICDRRTCRGRVEDKGLRSRLWLGLLGGALLTGSAGAAAQSAPGAVAPAASENPFPAEAAKLGVKQCANLFSALGQAASQGSTYVLQAQAESAAPDDHSAEGVLGLTYDRPDHSGHAAGVILVSPVGDGCEGQMVRVVPFPQSCADTVGLLPAGSTPAWDFAGVPLYNLAGNQGQALLVSSGTGCVVVTVARAVDTR